MGGKKTNAMAYEKNTIDSKDLSEEKAGGAFDVGSRMIDLMDQMQRSEKMLTTKNGGAWNNILEAIDNVRGKLEKSPDKNSLDDQTRKDLDDLHGFCLKYLNYHKFFRFSIEGRRRKRYARQLMIYINQYLDS